MRNTLIITKSTSQQGIRFFKRIENAKCFPTELLPAIIDRGPSLFTNVKESSIMREGYHSFSNFYNFYSVQMLQSFLSEPF